MPAFAVAGRAMATAAVAMAVSASFVRVMVVMSVSS
jgi:hypothetical protein